MALVQPQRLPQRRVLLRRRPHTRPRSPEHRTGRIRALRNESTRNLAGSITYRHRLRSRGQTVGRSNHRSPRPAPTNLTPPTKAPPATRQAGPSYTRSSAQQTTASSARSVPINNCAAKAAKTYAADGQEKACLTAIGAAETAPNKIDDQAPSYVYLYDEGLHISNCGECHLALRNGDRAADYAQQSLATLNPSYNRIVALTTVNLGRARVHAMKSRKGHDSSVTPARSRPTTPQPG